MTQLRIPNNTKITANISSHLNTISYSFLLYLICFLFFCKIASFGVNAQQQINSDGTIAIPGMQWIDLKRTLKGTAPPGLKDFAFGYSKESNLVIIFGGTTPSGSQSGATYLLDLTDSSWKTQTDFGTPNSLNPIAPEARSKMIFGVDKSSSYRNAFIIACGQGSGDVIYNDVWAFDFSYKQWTKVNKVTGEIPSMYGSIGGIDTTLATSFQIEETNTLWTSHGRNGTHFFTDLYALVISGTLSPNNLAALSATWYKIPVGGGSGIPSGRSSLAGTILPNKRLALYGGCDRIEGDCATSDTYTLDLGSNYTYGNVNSATPLWSKKNSCFGARLGAAMVMNSNPAITYSNQAIVYGGSSPDGKPVGFPGEIGVFDAGLGNWVRVLPQKDPVSGVPPQRTGARMVPVPIAIGTPGGAATTGVTATDILLFGGESVDGNNNNLNDIWILRLNSSFVTGDTAKSTNSPMEFYKCIIDPTGGTVIKPGTGTNTGTGDSKNSGSDYSDKSTMPIGHVTFSTISFACLPLAASVIRFGYGSNQKWAIAGLYTIFIVASYATAFYGFAIAFQDRQKSGHFNTTHGLSGLVLLVLLYIIVPSMAIVSLFASKKYESDSISNDDSDNDKVGIGSKFFNWRNSESNSKTAKSFEVSRPGNQSQSPPLKSSDNWMEKRKSVTTHPTMSSQGSSLQYVPSSRRTSQSTAVSRSGLQTSPSNTSAVIIIRRTHHIIAQIVLILTVIFIGVALIGKKVVDSLYFYIFVVFMVIIYLIWLIAARYGYPKGRNSLLVLFMHKVACGKGEINETKQYDFGENYGSSRNSATPAPSSNRMRIEDDDMDEEAEQAQLEQDMHNREVVVMTIPKRRLTVVNA